MNQEIQESSLKEQKKKNPNFIFGILCVIGSAILSFVYPSIFSFHTFCVYQTSYIKHNGGDADIIYTMFYYPVTLLFQSFFGLLAGIVFSKVGVHWSNLIGTSVFILAGLIMYLSTRFYLDMIACAMYGISVSILMFPTAINACKYFMNHIGLINGIIETSQSLGTTFFAFIGEQIIINPDKIPSNEIDHLYDENIAKNVKKFLLIQIFSCLGVFLVEEIITKTYNENNKEKFSIKFLFRINEIKSLFKKKYELNLIDVENDSIQPINRESSGINEIEENVDNIKEIKQVFKTRKEKIKMVLKSWKFWRYNLISLSQSPIGDMIFAMCRGIAETYHVEQNAIQIIGTLAFIIEFIFSFIFGILCDYVDFRILTFINNMIGSIVGITYYHTFQNSVAFSILTLFMSIQSAGYYSLKDCHLMKVFGTDIYIDLSGAVCLTTGICTIILTSITYFIEKILGDKDTAYLIIFPVFGLFNFCGVILGFFEDEEPFDYNE